MMSTNRFATATVSGADHARPSAIAATGDDLFAGPQPIQARTKSTVCQRTCSVCKKSDYAMFFGNSCGIVCIDCLVAANDIED